MEEEVKNITTTDAPAIFRAIAGVMADVGSVSKDKINKQQGFKYRSIDDVYDALHPALAKNKVFIVPQILERTQEVVGTSKNGAKITQTACKIKFTFYAEDGSSVEAIIVGEGMDMGDKGTNKAMAIAYKYACFQVFCIPTEDMVDPDAEGLHMELAKTTAKHGSGTGRSGAARTSTITNASASVRVEKTTHDMMARINEEVERTGKPVQGLLDLFNIKSLEEMTMEQYEKAMKKFKITPDKKPDGILGGKSNE